MIELPDRVKVGPLVFRLIADEDEHQKMCSAKGEYLFGTTRIPRQEIVIDPKLPLGQLQDTVLHEVMHAVWWVAGLRDTEEGFNEEKVIETTSTILLDTLQRNPMLVAFLMQQEE